MITANITTMATAVIAYALLVVINVSANNYKDYKNYRLYKVSPDEGMNMCEISKKEHTKKDSAANAYTINQSGSIEMSRVQDETWTQGR